MNHLDRPTLSSLPYWIRPMHPLAHAESSAALHGGTPSDFIAIHDWFDATKAQVCHVSHRMFRHHRQGIDEAIATFGPEIRVTGEQAFNVDVLTLGLQHMQEDTSLGRCPDAGDWLQALKLPAWLRADRVSALTGAPEELAAASARSFGGEASQWMPLHRWFLETETWSQGNPAHLSMRHHAMGIFEAESRFGRSIPVDEKHVPLRPVAERHVRTVLGRIPSAADWCSCLRAEAWMLPPRGG